MATPRVSVANAVATLDDPLSSTCVFDHTIWEQPGRNGLIPANPHLVNEGAALFEGGDLDTLAAKTGLNATALKQTVASFNAALTASGGAAQFTPADGITRRNKKYKPMPIVRPPFYAVPMVSGITYTMGGIVINTHAQALREDGSAIPGLYAAGAATGGLEGGPQIGYVGGLAKSGITGLAAAEHIAVQ